MGLVLCHIGELLSVTRDISSLGITMLRDAARRLLGQSAPSKSSDVWDDVIRIDFYPLKKEANIIFPEGEPVSVEGVVSVIGEDLDAAKMGSYAATYPSPPHTAFVAKKLNFFIVEKKKTSVGFLLQIRMM